MADGIESDSDKQKGKYVINDIATAFGKENFITWLGKRKDNILYVNQEKSQDLVRQSQLQKQNNVSSGVVHKGSASSKGAKYPTLPHLLGQLETAHVGVVGNRTFSESPASVRSVPTQLRKMVHQNKASNQSILSPNDVVNFCEQHISLCSRTLNCTEINIPNLDHLLNLNHVFWVRTSLRTCTLRTFKNTIFYANLMRT